MQDVALWNAHWGTVIPVALAALPFVLSLLIACWVRRRLKRRFPRQRAMGAVRARLGLKWRLGYLAGASLFAGLMIASAGGAVAPRLLQPAAELLCDGAVQMQSRRYAYKPGQVGVSRTLDCVAVDGQRRDIALISVFMAAMLYGGALFLLGLLWTAVGGRREASGSPSFRERGAGTAGRAHPRSSDARAVLDAMPGMLGDALGEDVARSVEEALAAWGGEGTRHTTVRVNGRIVAGDAEPDVASRLRQLNALREQGLVSVAEYEAKRAEILARL